MASSLLRLFAKKCIKSPGLFPKRAIIQPFVKISTSKKTKDVTTVAEPSGALEPWRREVEKEVEAKTKNWVSYGYSITDRGEDEWHHILIMFLSVTCCIVGGTFIFAYMPDYKMKDWLAREAFMELARREREGLPLVDANYISPEIMISQLPSDEELGNTDIIL